jgi:Bacterial nucleoid DNA-binding protein
MREDGRPVYRSIVDPRGTAAKKIGMDVNKERVVNNSDFFKHINAEVFTKLFGVPMGGRVARMIIEGMSDQCLVLTEKGYRIKMPNLVVMERVECKARKARNPRTGEEVQVPARTALSAKPTRSAKHYMAQAD